MNYKKKGKKKNPLSGRALVTQKSRINNYQRKGKKEKIINVYMRRNIPWKESNLKGVFLS